MPYCIENVVFKPVSLIFQTSARLQPPPPANAIKNNINNNSSSSNSKNNNKVVLSNADQSLIDFSEDIRKCKDEMRHITKVSVLEAFDPLLLSDEEELPPDVSKARGKKQFCKREVMRFLASKTIEDK